MVALPRLVIAAPASGHGKTTIATGLMAALRKRGHVVSGHKVGPDYIDPGYHSLATGRPGRNLDPHLVGENRLAPLLIHGAAGADLAIVEGVMGLYDGALGRDGFASTAHVAGLIEAPVVLVVDVSHASRSIGAVVHGMASFDPSVRLAGVILNKAGSPRHADEVRNSLAGLGIPVLGTIGRYDDVEAPSRHLGLVPADERPDAAASLDRLAAQIAEHIDLDEVVRIARSAPNLTAAAWSPADEMTSVEERPRAASRNPASERIVAVAGGRAFTFRYAETEELLRAAGLTPVVFDPMNDEALPEGTSGIYIGGGFPEVYAAGLSANEPLRAALKAAIVAGIPTVGECAGLLYLCDRVDGAPMVGVIDADAGMTPRLTLAYRSATAPTETLLASAGTTVTGHEFHRTAVLSPMSNPAWDLGGKGVAMRSDGTSHLEGFSLDPAGLGRPTVHASYLHTHWAGYPEMARRFASAVGQAWVAEQPKAASRNPAVPQPLVAEWPKAASRNPAPAFDLRHHGDVEVGDLADFAVNVHPEPAPDWLQEAITGADLGRYPSVSAATAALAALHGVGETAVLPTSGAAEAFTLIARIRKWRKPVVVHPQFTEPESALAAAGHHVTRWLLRPEDGFALDPVLVPADADLVVVGNPTNPTGVLHSASTLRRLTKPGRLVVVDEAFMDWTDETQSLISEASGLLVVRSLTKLWSIPGIRAGYLIGDPAAIGEAAAVQPHWSVSAPALAAIVACAEHHVEGRTRAASLDAAREQLIAGLRDLGLPIVGAPATPFVLTRGPEGLREALRDRGFAVRRADTFPGLGVGWIRIAVRDDAAIAELLDAVKASL